jgi:hypothetical protein
LEEDDIRGDFGKSVLFEGRFRQTDGPQEVGGLRDMLPNRGIGGVQKETADHKGADAAFPQQTYGLGKKVVVDGEAAKFREKWLS